MEARAPLFPHGVSLINVVPFAAAHVVAVALVVWLGWSWKGLAVALASYTIRMFWVTAGYHRYFSHRSFRTSRAMQFVFAFLAMTSAQKGILWWAAHHRAHHRNSDEEGDPHSVLRRGFFLAHMGWVMANENVATDERSISDLLKYPELRWLDRWWILPPTLFAVALLAIGGPWLLTWGFFVSTVLLWHGSFSINSLAHMFGSRRYATSDNSKNSFLLAVLTLGEGWHNNHHHYQRSTRQGFFFWEIDVTYYVLVVMSVFGLVWDLSGPPANVRDAVAVSG